MKFCGITVCLCKVWYVRLGVWYLRRMLVTILSVRLSLLYKVL